MAKLTGAKKKAFLERMAKGRRKAARGNPVKKKTARKKSKRPQSKKTPRQKHLAAMKKTVRTGKGHAKLEKRRAQLKKKNAGPRSVRKSKKEMKRMLPGFKRKSSRGRRNSEDMTAAERMYETFHQRPPGSIVEYDELVNYPDRFAELGKLIELRVFLDDANRDFRFTRFGDCKAVSTPDGNNIYFVGGDQSIDLESLEISSDKDTIELGPCTYICYHTVKGFHDFEPTNYWHRFGEENGVFPRLGYDRLNKRLFLIGGDYQVKRPGIVN
jgi:hypothetical protein